MAVIRRPYGESWKPAPERGTARPPDPRLPVRLIRARVDRVRCIELMPQVRSTLAVVTKRQTGVYLVIAMASVCCLSLCTSSASAATSTEPGYACGLVHASLLSATYGKGLRAEKRPAEVANGSGQDFYGSGCTVTVTKKRKDGANRRRSPTSSRRFRVGTVRLFTLVAAEGAPGEIWSAATQEAADISYAELWMSSFGGSAYPIDTFGQSEVHAYLLGSKELSTEAFWRHGENGVISIGLHDSLESPPRLEQLLSRIAAGIVPEFSP